MLAVGGGGNGDHEIPQSLEIRHVDHPQQSANLRGSHCEHRLLARRLQNLALGRLELALQRIQFSRCKRVRQHRLLIDLLQQQAVLQRIAQQRHCSNWR